VVFAGATLAEPLVGFVPDQPPPAVQVEALVLVQLKVEFPPDAICVGLAVSVTVGAGVAVTVTVADARAEPPDPVQESV